MTLLKDNDYKEINVALLSLEADIKNKITNFDTSVIDRQLAEINSRIDKINAGGNNSSAAINDIRTEIEDINSKLNSNSAKIENIEQKLSDIFSAENKVTDFNTTTDSGIYYWLDDAANRPGTDYGVLLVNKYDSGDITTGLWINQIAYGTNSKIYFRQNINSGNWTEWKAVAFEDTARMAADTGYLCKLYQLANATQTYNVILLGKIPDPASTAAPATPASSWDIDVDFYFVRTQGHKAAWCNVKAGYGYSNAWRKYGFIETFGVDSDSNYTNPFYLVTVKYNNEYYIGVRHTVNINGGYSARVKNVNIGGNRNPSDVIDNTNTSLVNMLKVIPYQRTKDDTVLNSEVKSSITDFDNGYAPTVLRNGSVQIGTGNVTGIKLILQGSTVSSNSYTDANPKLEFKNADNSQNISLTFTDFGAVQAPASLTLNGNQGNEYFIAPCIKANNKLRIPIGAPSSLEDGCIWIER